MHKMPKINPEALAYHQDADREIDLMERIQAWLRPDANNLRGSDKDIAKRIEQEFGIPQQTVFEYLQDGSGQESTFESVWKAYNKWP